MSIVIGVWFALAGGLAVLAGLSAMRRARRLRSSGLSAWAMIVASPAAPDQPPHGSARRMLVQFALANGQVIERNVIQSPESGRTAPWPEGARLV